MKRARAVAKKARRSSNSGTKGCRRWAPDAAGGVPQHLGRGGHFGPMVPAGSVRSSGGAPCPPQEADRGLAMDARDGYDFVQDRAFLRPGGGLGIPLPRPGCVLAKAGSGRGHLLCGLGNRDF